MLRASEWLLLAYFSYVAIVASWFFSPWEAWELAAIVAGAVFVLSRRKSILRDFAPLAFTLLAYREMNWFTPAVRDHHLEQVWIVWDRWLLDQSHLRAAIEAAGAVLPSYFEFCYLLVYGVAPVSIVLLFLYGKRDQVGRFWLAYLAGTLGAYALFPYFLSEPPRIAFAGADLPNVVTGFRQLNLSILGGYAIHSSVFPSAHVSSVFSAAWGLLATIPDRPWIGWLMALYGLSVAVGTIYGRYHYAVDAVAGIAISLVALVALRLSSRQAPDHA
jgi:membrane-associated phospholipid phosphatase